jgi:hypothetical protein
MREVYPVKYYSREGFVERKIEINEEDLQEILEDYLRSHAEFDFDEVEVVNNRPMNVWLYAKCRTYLDADDAEAAKWKAADAGAEVEVTGEYDGNPTGA